MLSSQFPIVDTSRIGDTMHKNLSTKEKKDTTIGKIGQIATSDPIV